MMAGCAAPGVRVPDAWRARPNPVVFESLACRTLVDAAGRPIDAALAWPALPSDADTSPLASACGTVGPAVYEPPPRTAVSSSGTESLVIASWNVHVGGGDLETFVSNLRGEHAGGAGRDIVVLVQEAFRGGGGVPAAVEPGIDVPARIVARDSRGARTDVVRLARRLGLGVFYVPSMRNGREGGVEAEDRGNAILTTRPLAGLTAIVLPYQRQRRVAAAATIDGTDADGHPWQVRVVSSHLDAGSTARRLWLRSGAARDRQARHLVDVLAREPVATVVGADLNTWAGGPREDAYRTMREEFPQTPGDAHARYRGELTLDYLFFRVPETWAPSVRVVDDRLGSDHRPLIGVVRVGTG